MNRKWAIGIGAVIMYVTLLLLFGPAINIVLIIGAIAWVTYKYN